MTSVTDVKDLAADFLFELCSRNGIVMFSLFSLRFARLLCQLAFMSSFFYVVDRLVKYTGFGNAVGMLSNQGLLGSRSHDVKADISDDENSDTEEYLRVRDQ